MKSKTSQILSSDKVTGSKLKILKYPHPQLRVDNDEVTVFDVGLKETCQELLKIMYSSDGIGLAAPQVGINKRIMVFNEDGDDKKTENEMILINPKIISKSESTDVREEGCLSFPMIYGKVVRSLNIDVEYQNISGEKLTKTFEGMSARIFQHEYDHLDKVVFILITLCFRILYLNLISLCRFCLLTKLRTRIKKPTRSA